MSYQRKREEKKRLKQLYDKTKTFYGSGAWYDEEKGRYVQYWIAPRRKKLYKKIANKKVRKHKGDLQGNSHRKVFDLWWELL